MIVSASVSSMRGIKSGTGNGEIFVLAHLPVPLEGNSQSGTLSERAAFTDMHLMQS